MARTLEQRIADAVREEVAIVDYSEAWPELFAAEERFLRSILPVGVLGRIEHFGSTAVPGLAAKPVLDLLVEACRPSAVITEIVPCLQAHSYEYFWRTDVANPYAWFIKRDGQGHRSHHLHVIDGSSTLWERLLFRDYLRAHAGEALAYAGLKRRLAIEHSHDRVAYTQGKSEYIEMAMVKARLFYGAT